MHSAPPKFYREPKKWMATAMLILAILAAYLAWQRQRELMDALDGIRQDIRALMPVGRQPNKD